MLYENMKFDNQKFQAIIIDGMTITGDVRINDIIFYPVDKSWPPFDLPVYKNCEFSNCYIERGHIKCGVDYDKCVEILTEITKDR